jgi:hypothetical protein
MDIRLLAMGLSVIGYPNIEIRNKSKENSKHEYRNSKQIKILEIQIIKRVKGDGY